MTLKIRICTGAKKGTSGAMDLMIARKLLLPVRHIGAGEFLSVALAAVLVPVYGMIIAVSFGGIRKPEIRSDAPMRDPDDLHAGP